MAFSTRNRDSGAIAEINVTPFVDVVLVLLIIFMITAGVVEFGLDIEVPRTREVATSSKDYDFVNITGSGEVYLGTEPISIYDIAPRIKETKGENAAVYVRAHRTTPWEVIAQVVAECGAGGIKVNMITKPLERMPRRRR
jgi:biopolymer transport protein ExbD